MMLMMMVVVVCFPRRNVFHFLLLSRFQLRCFPDKQSKLLVAINIITLRMKVEKFRFSVQFLVQLQIFLDLSSENITFHSSSD